MNMHILLWIYLEKGPLKTTARSRSANNRKIAVRTSEAEDRRAAAYAGRLTSTVAIVQRGGCKSDH